MKSEKTSKQQQKFSGVKKLFATALSYLPTPIKYSAYRKLAQIPSVLPEGLVFKIAETKEELEQALALLHDSYVEVGLMKPDLSGLRVTAYHALPSSTTLIGKINNDVVATMTVIRDSPMGLPCDVFVDLNHLRQSGDRIAEISALAIKRGYRGQLLLHFMKFLYESCTNYLGINHLIATLTTDSKSHELYESILFFKPIQIKVETNYAFSNFRPVIAEHLNLTEAYAIFEKNYNHRKDSHNLFQFFTKQVLNCNQYPTRKNHQINFPVMNSENFDYFFTSKTSALQNMETYQLEAARKVFIGQPQEKMIVKILAERNVYAFNQIKPRARFEVSFTALSKCNQQLAPVRVLDISREGLRLSSLQTSSDLIEVYIQDSSGNTKSIKAQKIWENNHGVYGYKIIQSNSAWHSLVDFHDGVQNFGTNQLQPVKAV